MNPQPQPARSELRALRSGLETLVAFEGRPGELDRAGVSSFGDLSTLVADSFHQTCSGAWLVSTLWLGRTTTVILFASGLVIDCEYYEIVIQITKSSVYRTPDPELTTH